MSNYTDVNMGLPRVSGKRKWSETEDVPSKVLCTSPPHALCAEDVLPSTANQVMKTSEEPVEPTTETFTSMETQLSESDEEFIDDEEDKDSGFIDGNSIDNSSDDDDSGPSFKDISSNCFPSSSNNNLSVATNGLSTTTSSFVTTNCFSSTNSGFMSVTNVYSISKGLISTNMRPPTPTPNQTGFLNTSTSLSNAFTSSMNTITVTSDGFVSSNSIVASCATVPPAITSAANFETKETTNGTSKCTGTMVTASYPGAVPSVSYDLHTYGENYRPATPAWSCNFYDQHSNTNKYMEISPSNNKYMEISPNIANKYMEISPNRPTSQSIQCDENGKSYIELGNASPFNNNYTECTNYTTAAYQNSSYTLSFTNGNNFNSSNNYYNRQSYNQNMNYNECYSYENNMPYYYNNGTRTNGLNRATRCTSPYCDVTKTSPRPACYSQQRLSVFNMSMFKLNRFSRYPESSLHRSVLICNTLRHIEKEFESEGISMAAVLANHNHAYAQCHNHSETLPSTPPPSTEISPNTGEGPLPSIQQPIATSPFPSVTLTTSFSHPVSFTNEEKTLPSLRSYPPVSESQTPEASDWTARNIVTEEKEGINWCSVLSLSSQSDLHSTNSAWNSEESLPYDESTEKLPSLSADDVLKSFPDSRRQSSEQMEVTIKDLLDS